MDTSAQLALQLLKSHDYGIVLVDAQRRILVWNSWMEAQTQQLASAVHLTPLDQIIAGSTSRARVIEALNKAIVLQQATSISVAICNTATQQVEMKPLRMNGTSFCLLEIHNTIELSDQIAHQDNAVASHLFTRIEQMRGDDIPGLTVWQQQSKVSSGDIVLSAPRPSGGINILIADFIGRGLPAAVGALPMAEVFYGMTQKGFGLTDIIEEINNKLLFVLPEGLYCATCFIELEQEGKMLAVWNGGLPDVLITDQSGKIKHHIPSSHIPLGITQCQKTDRDAAFIEVMAGDRVVMYSKGVLTAKNNAGEEFGWQQFESLLTQSSNFRQIHTTIADHIGNKAQQDNLTLLMLDVNEVRNYAVSAVSPSNLVGFAPEEWQAAFEFSAKVLRHLDLAPLLVNVLMQIQAPYEHRQRIYTVLAEICSNALDHGVLGLHSSMKDTANGFASYYALRGQRLASLEQGYIKVVLAHQVEGDTGKLLIQVEDSGDGFDYQRHANEIAENNKLCGRGENLLQQLCSEFYYSGKGNICHAVYLWSQD